MSFRCVGVSCVALALPPLSPPSLPRATAAGFLPLVSGGALGSVLGFSPVISPRMRNAAWLASSRFLERFGIPQSYRAIGGPPAPKQTTPVFKLGHHPVLRTILN